MNSKFHERAIARITPEQRALMVKSLEILSQIHAILESRDITQKALAAMLKVSQAAVSKMLSPGGNLGLNTVVRLELLLGETIVTTPQKAAELEYKRGNDWRLPEPVYPDMPWMNVAFQSVQHGYFVRSN